MNTHENWTAINFRTLTDSTGTKYGCTIHGAKQDGICHIWAKTEAELRQEAQYIISSLKQRK